MQRGNVKLTFGVHAFGPMSLKVITVHFKTVGGKEEGWGIG